MYTERIELEGSPNTRDLGGMPAAGGKTIRSGRIIRSGRLSQLTDKDAAVLSGMGLKQVVDFRTHVECENDPDKIIPGVTYTNLPVLTESAMGITREKEDRIEQLEKIIASCGPHAHMRKMYEDIMRSTTAPNAYRAFFQILLSCESGAVLWHCTAGKDRAGLGSALIEMALGVPIELVKQDYLASAKFLEPVNRQYSELLLSRGASRAVADTSGVMMSVHESYLETVLQYMRAEYGGQDGYLKAIGVGEAEKKRLRQLYLEG